VVLIAGLLLHDSSNLATTPDFRPQSSKMGNNRGKIQFLLKLHLYAASLWGIVLQDGFFGTAV